MLDSNLWEVKSVNSLSVEGVLKENSVDFCIQMNTRLEIHRCAEMEMDVISLLEEPVSSSTVELESNNCDPKSLKMKGKETNQKPGVIIWRIVSVFQTVPSSTQRRIYPKSNKRTKHL